MVRYLFATFGVGNSPAMLGLAAALTARAQCVTVMTHPTHSDTIDHYDVVPVTTVLTGITKTVDHTRDPRRGRRYREIWCSGYSAERHTCAR